MVDSPPAPSLQSREGVTDQSEVACLPVGGGESKGEVIS